MKNKHINNNMTKAYEKIARSLTKIKIANFIC